MKLKTKLMIAGLIFLFCFMTYLKVLGSTDLGIDVEKKGYCKQYGKDWKYSENGYCFDFRKDWQIGNWPNESFQGVVNCGKEWGCG